MTDLETLWNEGGTLAAADEVFRALPAIATTAVRGRYRGRELSVGHPMEGLLDQWGWYGKHFVDDDHVHPLLFWNLGRSGVFSVRPGWVPYGLLRRGANRGLPKIPLSKGWLALLRPVVSTRKGHARLRAIDAFGVPTAAMVYDELPIIDVFKDAGSGRLLGRMDARGFSRPYFFGLELDDSPLEFSGGA